MWKFMGVNIDIRDARIYRNCGLSYLDELGAGEGYRDMEIVRGYPMSVAVCVVTEAVRHIVLQELADIAVVCAGDSDRQCTRGCRRLLRYGMF